MNGLYISDSDIQIYLTYVGYSVIGWLTSLYLASSTCLISELIGEYGSSGGFV